MEEEFIVEEILDFKKINNENFFLIKWLGFQQRDNSWEAEEDIVKIFLIKIFLIKIFLIKKNFF